MNIFYLDTDIRLSASYHCDKHVVKMCIEYAQLLSSVVRLLNPELCSVAFPYKLTHKNHPCAVWARAKVGNYMMLRDLAIALGHEFERRYGKKHKSIELVERLPFPTNLIKPGFDLPPQCVPDDCKSGDTVLAYRTYYQKHKMHIARWKTNPPIWWNVD